MSKKIITYLSIIFLWQQTDANAICLEFAYDIDAKLIKQPCGHNDPQFNCKDPIQAWDGNRCATVPIMKICSDFNGEWGYVQFKAGADGFLEVCKCPNKLTWTGDSCANVAENSLIKSLEEDVKITKGLWEENKGSY